MNDNQEDLLDLSESLACNIGNLENYYADNILSEELVELYAEVQENCQEFREEIFFKNLDILENSLVNYLFTVG